MSEPETTAAPAAADAAPPEEKKGKKDKKEQSAKAAKAAGKSGPPPMVLLGIIAGALVIGGGLGFALVGPRVVAARTAAAAEHGAAGKKKEKKKEGGHGGEKAAAFRIDNLIVNPAGSQGTRFLMTTISVQATDEALIASLNAHEDQARDIVISTLESHSMTMLTRPGARDSLKAHLVHALTPIAMADYEPDPKKKGHEDAPEISVFLPQFVIQ